MKKYFVIALALSAVACNSNTDKRSEQAIDAESVKKDSLERVEAKMKAIIFAPDTTTGTGLISGAFEIIDHKINKVKANIPRILVRLTKRGDFIKSDGTNLTYKIEGEKFFLLGPAGDQVRSSTIEFLNPEKTSFIIKTDLDKSEATYQIIKK